MIFRDGLENPSHSPSVAPHLGWERKKLPYFDSKPEHGMYYLQIIMHMSSAE